MQKNRMLVALLAEYRRAAKEYIAILGQISTADFTKMRDAATADPDCHSVQTVTQHIVQSGYTYANYIGQMTGKPWNEYQKNIENPTLGIKEIEQMLDYTEAYFEGLWLKNSTEIEIWQVKARWGVVYDLEQLMEHAIVHILRHRRQVACFLQTAVP